MNCVRDIEKKFFVENKQCKKKAHCMYSNVGKVFSLVLCIASLQAQNKIIYLVSPPRTLSTVFLRFMHARGDMIVYNEPSQYAYLWQLSGGGIPGGFNTNIAFKTYAEAKESIISAAQEHMVFVKEPSCGAYASIYRDDAFLTNPNVEFCFIIRDPHASIVSYYRALGMYGRGLNDFGWSVERRIYELQYALYKKITKLRRQAPVVLSSEELANNPERVLSAFCDRVGIEFNATMLNWPSMEKSFDPLDWHDSKTLPSCNQWHKAAIVSTEFRPLERHYAVNNEGKPTFAEFDPKYSSTLNEIYENYMSYYNKMFVHRIRY